MTSIKERLTNALNERDTIEASEVAKKDISSYVWKGPKEELNGQKFQDEIKLVDASDSQLMEFYAHCKSMLYSRDSENPGRYLLIEEIRESRQKCDAELMIRYLEGSYKPSTTRSRYPRQMFCDDFRTFIQRNTDTFPSNRWKEFYVTEFLDGLPEDFWRVTIDMAWRASNDKLGHINKKPITLNFLTKLGIWLEPDEIKDLTEKDPETGKRRDYLEVIKERLFLKPTTRLKVNSEGGLSYKEFRAMVKLHNEKYISMSTDKLVTLREKILYRLEDVCTSHIVFWENKIKELEEVAASRGWNF